MKDRIVYILIIPALLFLNLTTAAQYDPVKFKTTLDDLVNSSEDKVAFSLLQGDIPNFYPSEITATVRLSYPAIPEDKTIRVLPFVREHMITTGKDYDRVKSVAGGLLKFMGLQERVRVIYFDSEVPVTAFSYPFALIVSSAAAQTLTDEKLDAVLSHEVVHLIIYQAFKEATDNKDLKKLRTLELFCDGAAISILSARGKDPKDLYAALDTMQNLLERVNNDSDSGMEHPTLKKRKQFHNQLIQKIDVATNRASK